MADFSYSGDPADSELDEARFLVQDTDPSLPLLTDTEVTYLLNKWLPEYGSVTYVAALAASVISRKYAGVVNINADGVSVNTADLSERYRAVAEQLREEYKSEGATGGLPLIDNILAGNEFDASIDPLVFGMSLHDNYLAGRQDYGGYGGAPQFDWNEMSWRQ